MDLCYCARAFSTCRAWASHCNGFSCCGAWALGHVSFNSYCTRAELPLGMWDLPGPGSDPCPTHWQADS